MTPTLPTPVSRRSFLSQAAVLAAAAGLSRAAESVVPAKASDSLAGRIYKTLKIGMIKAEGGLSEKFKVAKAAGFMGVELNLPGVDVAEARKAVADSGLVVDGSVCAEHWTVRHTSADAETRAKALKTLKQAIRDTRAVGGHSVLLVVGKGEDGPEEEIWGRSVENIAKAVPVAAEEGVQIVIENVWNQFCYNHDGDHMQSAEKFVKYVDEFRSSWVGMQFDIGNHWKYGSMGDWIRQLNRRVYKLDVKGYSRKDDKFTPIGEGDIDYADVRKALLEINYYGWLAAEVASGDLAYLTDVAQQMDRSFGL
jgi:hexulose-6-phosphate isomerase